MEAEAALGYGARIRQLRADLGLTQARLAESLGVTFATVNRWENGQTKPSALAWRRIREAERLGISALDGQAGVPGNGQHAAAAPVATSPEIDFMADPAVVQVVAEGERLTYGHLFNRAFAAETSLIDPLPHQRIAVYERMLPQSRLRFLIADDAGAGKTIMSGLYIREMLTRRLLRRVLIVPPAGLIGNWERELRTLFGLRFRIVAGNEARTGNPFIGENSDLLIVSVDTLAGERMFGRVQEAEVAPYDLVIFDEAHKLSADREADFYVRRTDRYRLAEALAGVTEDEERWALGWNPQHLLLLTATPHMGKDFPYYALWRLLEPDVLSTIDAFHAYPADARQRHFIRRTKEEMVRYDGSHIYPTRVSNTLSYELTQGEVSEQELYDRTTAYIQFFYNRAKILNRSAAQLAMSVFQRRLASSTYALMRSFERRLEKLERLIQDVRSGRLSEEQLQRLQLRLAEQLHDPFEEKTGDEESPQDGAEENEEEADRALGGVVGLTLSDLEDESGRVRGLLELARQVYERGEESKLDKLLEVIRDAQYRDEKFIIFTEHRDTLTFLVRCLEGQGFTGQVAKVHGAMDYRERDEQVAFFRRPIDEGGARYLVATDAAGEGINLQFCWLMVNYDIPWNPARLEQRMGRIHRYGQRHDPVLITNLVAGRTREGRVVRVLLEKLERIRRELGSDKVFDVVGRVLEGISLREYMARALTEEGARDAERRLEGKLTSEQVEALADRERQLYGGGGEVRSELPRLREDLERESFVRLLPGYVRRFVEKSAPLIDLGVDGDLEGFFSLQPLQAGALDALWPALESYPPEQRERLTVYRPASWGDGIWLHPGEPFFDLLRGHICGRFAGEALRGAVFVDPTARRPYLYHLALVSVVRRADPAYPALARGEVIEERLVGMRQELGSEVEQCPAEYLLLLRGSRGVPPAAIPLAATARQSRELALAYATEGVGRTITAERREALVATLREREEFIRRGFAYQDAELTASRRRVRERANAGIRRAGQQLEQVKSRQRTLTERRDQALASLRRETELLAVGEVRFLAHALVTPSSDPEDAKRYDAAVEAIAVHMAEAFEQGAGARVQNVSTPELARAAGLSDWPGFDLLAHRPQEPERAIEVKGRAGEGNVELSENEWAKACNLRERYWLYVVFDCGTAHPRLLRVQDPFGKLLMRPRGGVLIDEREIIAAAEWET